MDHAKMKYYPTKVSKRSSSSSCSESSYYLKSGKSQVHLENTSTAFKKCNLPFTK